MTIKFTSKEIHFLKSDSENANFIAPQNYFCDLLLTKTDSVKNFEKRLSKIDIPHDNFLSAVLQVAPKTSEGSSEETLEKAKETFEVTFNSFLDHERGIWETLDETAMIIAFWDYKNEEKAIDLLISLKEKISVSLNTDILTGVAFFPFHDFTKPQTFGNALKAIDHAAFFGPNTLQTFDATSLNISADRLYQVGQYELAIEEYKKGLEIAPRDANLLNSLGVCYGIMNKLGKAKKQFENAMTVAAKETMVIYNIGLLYNIKKEIDTSIIYLRKAHGIDPNVFEVELLLGQQLLKQDHPEQAMPHLKEAARLNPDSGLAFRLMGEIHLANERPQKAAAKFNTAIKLSPSDAVSLSGYAKSLELVGKNLNIALSFATNSVTLDPNNLVFQERLKSIQKTIDSAVSEEATIKSA